MPRGGYVAQWGFYDPHMQAIIRRSLLEPLHPVAQWCFDNPYMQEPTRDTAPIYGAGF
jgi:hypothetical protein